MALSDEQISLMAFNNDPGDWNNLAFRDCWVNGYKTGARAIEAEVRKQDDVLIQQMLEALNTCDESYGYNGLRQFFDEKAVESAITTARARLGEKT